MALINYSDLELKQFTNKENIILNIYGKEVQIVPYLSIQDKYDLIMGALHKSYDNGIYNDIILKMYFELHIIYLYTNILFSIEDRADEIALYDTLVKSGVMQTVLEAIPETELVLLERLINNVRHNLELKNNSVTGAISNFVDVLPKKLEKLMPLLEKINFANIQEAVEKMKVTE